MCLFLIITRYNFRLDSNQWPTDYSVALPLSYSAKGGKYKLLLISLITKEHYIRIELTSVVWKTTILSFVRITLTNSMRFELMHLLHPICLANKPLKPLEYEFLLQLQELDLNQWPLGYEPNELPDCYHPATLIWRATSYFEI